MADNITAPASGSVLATKDLGGVHYPRNLITDEAGADAVGVVGASPSANTVLGRLKAIADSLTTLAGHVDGLEALSTALNGFVDGIEALIGTTNTSLTTIGGYVDGLETLQGTTNTTLTALNGFVDGLEGLLGAVATEATLAALSAKLPTLGPKAGTGSVSVVPSTDQDPIYDHAAGVLTAVTTDVTLLTTAAGHKYIRVSSDADALIRTDGSAAANNGGSVRIYANQPEVIPVPPSIAIHAMSVSGTANIRATPMKVR